jgi:hypothetical protein
MVPTLIRGYLAGSSCGDEIQTSVGESAGADSLVGSAVNSKRAFLSTMQLIFSVYG